jgi:hypothetical protein
LGEIHETPSVTPLDGVAVAFIDVDDAERTVRQRRLRARPPLRRVA